MTYDNDLGTTGMSGGTSISALFDSQADAQRAVDRLIGLGVPQAQIRMVDGGTDTDSTVAPADREKGFWESLEDFFFPDEDRYTYAHGLSRGGYLVTVRNLDSTNYEAALDILDDEGTVNLDEREASWRAEGWGGYEASPYAAGRSTTTTAGYSDSDSLASGTYTDTGRAYTDTGVTSDRLDADRLASDRLENDETIPVIEERLRVGKRDTSHGRVRVRAYTVEEPVNESVSLREERVEIERRPVDRPLSASDTAFRDHTIEAEEYREEAVVSKEARVVEEIGLRKTSDTREETISDTVRRTEVEIEDERGGTDRTGLDRTDIDRTRE
ncbi:YsnF/AvaK domain-containing protein [Paracoccus sp. SSK6]|uniref:YsnF/AvaK domain-containing protein n=1 Tax=Paracoccus sp. SSK6 TaxID=3143131 RepID=UPI003219F876